MEITDIKTITINGEEYVRKSDIAPLKASDTEHIIVIAQRGWIFIGYLDKSDNGKMTLINSSVVRKWSNGRGIGGLTKAEYKNEYTLDPVGTVSFAPEGIIAKINCEW